MGIISSGITTMGIWEYSPKSRSHDHRNYIQKIPHVEKGIMKPGHFKTKEEAKKAASEYECNGVHKMGE